jgi:hypothetical protein
MKSTDKSQTRWGLVGNYNSPLSSRDARVASLEESVEIWRRLMPPRPQFAGDGPLLCWERAVRTYRPLEAKARNSYWLRVWSDGTEQAFEVSAQDCRRSSRGLLHVSVLHVEPDGAVTEEVRTCNAGSLKCDGWTKPVRGVADGSLMISATISSAIGDAAAIRRS